MFIDNKLVLSDDADTTGGGQEIAADVVSKVGATASYIDQQAAGGDNAKMFLYVKVTKAFSITGDGANLKISLEHSADNASSDAYASVIDFNIAPSALTLGAELIKLRIPTYLKRYIRLNYDVTGTVTTAGKVFAALVDGVAIQ